MKRKKYVIGVDGGGTKTIAALADLEGKILKQVRSGPSNLRSLGIERASDNIASAINEVRKNINKESILLVTIGLAAIEEAFKKEREKIKKAVSQKTEISSSKIKILSDQLVAFKSGTDKKDGVVLISGTGAVCHGWFYRREAKVSGWGWLDDEGSGFWAGQRGFQTIFKELDGRGEKTLIRDLVFKQFEVKNKEELMAKIYRKDFVRNVSSISVSIDKAARKGDKIAKEIFREAAKELANSAKQVIKKLNIEKESFPLVFVGKMFESNIILEGVKKEIKKVAPDAEFIRPKKEAVIGAVQLALEKIKL